MKLISMHIRNFMPYKGDHHVEFPESDTNSNVLVVFGDNMRGKTSFLNAIRWGFFGKAISRHLSQIPRADIVNYLAAESGDWHVQVDLKFESEGDHYDLRREMKLRETVASPTTDNDFKVHMRLSKNGDALTQEQGSHEINQIIPEQVSRFFLFDGELLEEYETLVEMEESDQSRDIKEKIEQVLGVPALVQGRDQLQSLLKKAQSLQSKELSHVEALKAQTEQMQQLDDELEAHSKDRAELDKKLDKDQKEIDKLEEELRATQSFQTFKDEYDSIEAQIAETQNQEQSLTEERLELLVGAWQDLLEPRLSVCLEQLEGQRDELAKKIETNGELKSRVASLKKIQKSSTCSICEQEISKAQRDKFGAELGKLEIELEGSNNDMTELSRVSAEISNLSKVQPSGAAQRIQRIEKELNTINVKVVKLESRKATLEKEIAKYDSAEIARKRSRRDNLLIAKGTVEKDLETLNKTIAEKSRKRDQLSKVINRNPKAKATKGSLQVEIYSELAQLFEAGVDELRDDLRTNVQKLSTKAFKKLSTEKDYSGLQINKSYGLTILDKDRKPVSQRSAGAEQIVALSLIDGLNRTARKTGPIVMDTPLGRLDKKHRENVLKYIPLMAEQVILLVHDGEIEKDKVVDALAGRIGTVMNIERVSARESRLNVEV